MTRALLTQALAKYRTYLFGETAMNRACLFRIAVGGLLIYTVLDIQKNHMFWANWTIDYPFRAFWVKELLNPSVPSPEGVLWTSWIALIAALPLTVGFFSRASALICFVSLTVLRDFAPFILKGSDHLMRNFTLILAMAPCGSRFSVDAWIRRSTRDKFPAWPLRLMQLQVAIVYLITGLAKAAHPEWIRGEGVYYVTRVWMLQHYHLPYLLDHAWTLRLLSWGTVITEITLGLLLPFRALRIPLILVGVCLHVGLELCLFLPIWEWLMICSYILFIPGQLDVRIGKVWRQDQGASKVPTRKLT